MVETKQAPGAPSQDAHQQYLSDSETGVESALQAALHTLLRQESLPDNPAFFLAAVLTAFQDRAPGWSEQAGILLAELDASAPVVFSATRLVCRLQGFARTSAWGLPHVIRCVHLPGLEALHHVFVNDLHNSFFNSPAPFSVGAQGAVARVMCSLQGSAVTYNPDRQLFPKLQVRTDVLISGLSSEASVDSLAAMILRDARDIEQMPLNVCVAVRPVAPVTIDPDLAAERGSVAASMAMTLPQIESDTVAFFRMVKKAVLSSLVRSGARMHECVHIATSGAEQLYDTLCGKVRCIP